MRKIEQREEGELWSVFRGCKQEGREIIKQEGRGSIKQEGEGVLKKRVGEY